MVSWKFKVPQMMVVFGMSIMHTHRFGLVYLST
jgi:hypothetical protein